MDNHMANIDVLESQINYQLGGRIIALAGGLPSIDVLAQYCEGSFTMSSLDTHAGNATLNVERYNGQEVTSEKRDFSVFSSTEVVNCHDGLSKENFTPFSYRGRQFDIVNDNSAPLVEHIALDSYQFPSTQMCLSHWPGNTTPQAFRSHLSALSTYLYTQSKAFSPDFKYIYINHYDVDSVVSLYLYLNPDLGKCMSDFLVEVAHCGDFYSYANEKVLCTALAIKNIPRHFECDTHQQAIAQAIGIMGDIIENLDKYTHLWRADLEFIKLESQLLLVSEVTVNLDCDLTHYKFEDCNETRALFKQLKINGIDELSLIPFFNHTTTGNILFSYGNEFLLLQMYETWVEYTQKDGHGFNDRIDLRALANYLKQFGECSYTGVHTIRPRLRLSSVEGSPCDADKVIRHFMSFTRDSQCQWQQASRSEEHV